MSLLRTCIVKQLQKLKLKLFRSRNSEKRVSAISLVNLCYLFYNAVYSPPCGCQYNASYQFIVASRPYGGELVIVPLAGRSCDQYSIEVRGVRDYFADLQNESLTYTVSYQNDMQSDENVGELQ